MYYEFGAVLVFILFAVAFVVGSLVIGFFVRMSRRQGQKHQIYECGEPTIGSAWIRYNSRFYNVALVYLLFDVEVVLMIPVALVFRETVLQTSVLIPAAALIIFTLLLVIGLAYEWYYGNLDWIRTDKA